MMKAVTVAILLSAVLIAPSMAKPESTTSTEAALRDPFWPVGFTPSPKTVLNPSLAKSRIRSQTRWPKLTLRGITRTGKGDYIAIIDGIGLVEPGDVVSKREDNLIYRWRINTINAKGISRTRLDVREPTTTLQE
jgi:hypothetical protein